jgi:hypothetical protein
LLRFEALVAVTVTDVVLLTVGAVNKPAEEIVPALALQITAVSALLTMVAVNCNFAPDATVALSGEMIGIAMGGIGIGVPKIGRCIGELSIGEPGDCISGIGR